MPGRFREPASILLLNSTLPPNWPANMPKSRFFPEISSESCGPMLFGVPACYYFHILDRWMFYPSFVFHAAV